MKRFYSTWTTSDGHALCQGEDPPSLANGHPMDARAELLWTFEAGSHEEAMAIHTIRLGWGTYKPHGDPAPCPVCAAPYYPQGSGECWRCEHKD